MENFQSLPTITIIVNQTPTRALPENLYHQVGTTLNYAGSVNIDIVKSVPGVSTFQGCFNTFLYIIVSLQISFQECSFQECFKGY